MCNNVDGKYEDYFLILLFIVLYNGRPKRNNKSIKMDVTQKAEKAKTVKPPGSGLEPYSRVHLWELFSYGRYPLVVVSLYHQGKFCMPT